jgi:tetratricopeptide (TPR) repeat protein
MKQRALALSAAGQHDEAATLARQALDYLPDEPALLQIAAAPAPSPARRSLREALDYLDVGLIDQSVACLSCLIERAPQRLDIRLTLAQALWCQGLRVSAAQLCQAILEELPDCLNAHALLWVFWRQVGPAGFAALHLDAIARLDPDHRHTKALLGDESALAALEEPATQFSEDTEQVAEWVEALAAASTAAPKSLDRSLSSPAEPPLLFTTGNDALPANDEEGTPEPLAPLEWQLAEAVPDDQSAADDKALFEGLPVRATPPAVRRATRQPKRPSSAGRASAMPATRQQVIARYERAIAKSHAEQLDQIIAELEVMRGTQPADRTVYELLGMAYTRKGDLKAALDAYHHSMGVFR